MRSFFESQVRPWRTATSQHGPKTRRRCPLAAGRARTLTFSVASRFSEACLAPKSTHRNVLHSIDIEAKNTERPSSSRREREREGFFSICSWFFFERRRCRCNEPSAFVVVCMGPSPLSASSSFRPSSSPSSSSSYSSTSSSVSFFRYFIGLVFRVALRWRSIYREKEQVESRSSAGRSPLFPTSPACSSVFSSSSTFLTMSVAKNSEKGH